MRGLEAFVRFGICMAFAGGQNEDPCVLYQLPEKDCQIPSSFISRVSNATVLAKFSARPLSLQLLVRQLDYFGKLCAQSDDELTRCSALEPQATRPITWGMRKSVGRPRLRWTQCVHAQALLTVDGDASLMQTLVSSPGQRSWKKHLRSFLHDSVDAPS